MGMNKCHAIILRIFSSFFIYFGALSARAPFMDKVHIYGHTFVFGVFLYMMLVDILPILMGSQTHNHCLDELPPCPRKKKVDDCCIEPDDKHVIVEKLETASPSLDSLHEISEKEIGEIAEKHHHHHYRLKIAFKCLLFVIFLISLAIVAASIVVPQAMEKVETCQCNHGDQEMDRAYLAKESPPLGRFGCLPCEGQFGGGFRGHYRH